MSGIRPLLAEPSLKIRRTLAQVIVTMAHHEYLSLEGGDVLVKFIIQQCSVPDSVRVRLRHHELKSVGTRRCAQGSQAQAH